MKWYVLNYNFNAKQIEDFNIFNSVRFSEGVERALADEALVNDFEAFVKEIDSLAKYAFWSKREYEIAVGDLWAKEGEFEKIDVYRQIAPNIEIIANYILSNRG